MANPTVQEVCKPLVCSHPTFRELETSDDFRRRLIDVNEAGGTPEERLDGVAEHHLAPYPEPEQKARAREKFLGGQWGSAAKLIEIADAAKEACKEVVGTKKTLRCFWVSGVSDEIKPVVHASDSEVHFLLLTPAITNLTFSSKSFDAEFRASLKTNADDVQAFMERWWDQTEP